MARIIKRIFERINENRNQLAIIRKWLYRDGFLFKFYPHETHKRIVIDHTTNNRVIISYYKRGRDTEWELLRRDRELSTYPPRIISEHDKNKLKSEGKR